MNKSNNRIDITTDELIEIFITRDEYPSRPRAFVIFNGVVHNKQGISFGRELMKSNIQRIKILVPTYTDIYYTASEVLNMNITYNLFPYNNASIMIPVKLLGMLQQDTPKLGLAILKQELKKQHKNNQVKITTNGKH